MPFTVDMVSEEKDFNAKEDCGNCGREDVWTNCNGHCEECHEKEEEKQTDESE